MDARDLVLQERIREYWKEQNFMIDFKDQLILIMKAYTSVEEKKLYLLDMKAKVTTSEENNIINEALDLLNLKDRDKYNSDKYLKIYEYESSLDLYYSNSKLYESLSPFNGYTYSELINRETIEKYLQNSNSDSLVFEYIIDITSSEIVDTFVYFYIKGNILSLGYSNSYDRLDDNFINNYIIHMNPFYNKVSLYPFKDNSYVSIQTNDMKNPLCGHFYNYIEDYSNRQYIYILNHKLEEEEDIRSEDADISFSYFQKYYNIYDWMKEKEK